MAMRRLCWWVGAGFVTSVVGLAGCGQDPFGPPTRARPSVADEPREKSRTIFLISPTVPSQEIMAWGTEGQAEANQNHAIFRLMGPAPGETSVNQADLVKRAIDDNASGLLVIPGDSPDLGKALADAEAKGVAVALIGRSIPAPEGSKPFTVIAHAPFEESARKIVSTTIDDLKKAGRPVQGSALVLADRSTDPTSSARVAALKAAASAAGFARVVEVPIDGSNVPISQKEALEATKANPDLAIILTDDPETMVTASHVRNELKGNPVVFIGGYIDFGVIRVDIPVHSISCYAQGRYDQLAKLGVQSILAKLKGEPVAERVVLAPFFHRMVEEKEQAATQAPVRAELKSRTEIKPLPTPEKPTETPASGSALPKP
jgi:ABC-type sugar transport system substrate-binding protein